MKLTEQQIRKIFAENLRAERARKKLSQEAIAEKADITTGYVTNLEAEKYTPSIFVVIKLALALNITIDKLIPPEAYKE